MSTDSGDKLNLRHLHCRETHRRCMITKTSITVDELRQQGHRPPCQSNATAGTFAVFCTLTHTTGMQQHCPKNPTSCNCGISTVFSQTAPEECDAPAQQRHRHLVNELQLENLYGNLHRPDHEDRLRVTTGMSMTLTSEDCAPGVAQQRTCQTRSKSGT